MRRSTRVISATLAALLLGGAGLSACADGKKDDPAPTTSSTATPDATAPAAAPAATGGEVKVSGDSKAKPTVEVPKPFHVDKTVTNVVSKGTGGTLKAGDLARVDYVGINGTSGNEFDSSWSRKSSTVFPLTEGGLIAGFLKGLIGQQVGSRVQISIAPADGYTQGNSGAGIAATDTLVFVVDIRDSATPLAKAAGKNQPAPAGFPAVTLKDGIPSGVAADKTTVTETKSAVLIEGNGPAAVEKGKYLSFHYVATTAKDGKVFDNSFAATPISVPSLTDDLGVPGLAAALTGKKVGSRVIVMVPKALSKSATPPAGVTKDDTVVFVVDILAVL